MPHPSFWIAVACADHVARGVAGGFMQVCHGRSGPLGRIGPGDGVVYYSPAQAMGRADGLQSFTALGRVRDGQAYQVDMGGGFVPWRRDVDWGAVRRIPIRPLLDALDLTRGIRGWGQVFRFGLVRIGPGDFDRIAAAMADQPLGGRAL